MAEAKKYPFNGNQLTIPEIAKHLEITPAALYKRLRKTGGKVTNKTFCGFHEGNVLHYVIQENGSKITLAQFCRNHDLSYQATHNKYKKGARHASEFLKKKNGIGKTSEEKS